MILLNRDDVLLFQGDSITDGGRGRTNDNNHLLGHGYACMVSARLGADKFTARPVFLNRGQSGDGILNLYARWGQEAILLRPTVISLLIGVNDTCFYHPYDTEHCGMPRRQYERVYRMILEDSLEKLPLVQLVLCEPFFLPVPAEDGERLELYRRVEWEVREYQETVRQLAAEYNCIHVPLQEMFNQLARQTDSQYLIWDGVHPTMTGHEFIARQWIKTVEEKWRRKG